MKAEHLLTHSVSVVFFSWQLRKMKVEIGELAKNPMGYLLEAVHSAAYSGAMANPMYAPESAISGLTGDVLEKFVSVRSPTTQDHLQLCFFFFCLTHLVL